MIVAVTVKSHPSTIKMPIDYLEYVVYGKDYQLNDKITLHNPTIREIMEYGQQKYLSFVNLITMRPYDDMVGLDDAGLNYQEFTDYDMFLRNYRAIAPDISSLVLKDIDLTSFEIALNEETERPVLISATENMVIDEILYSYIASYVRRINFINEKIEYDAGDEAMRKYLINKQRKQIKKIAKKKNKSSNSFFGNMISLLCSLGSCKYGYEDIFNLKISQLYDNYYRINIIDERDRYLNILSSGMVKTENKDSSRLNWTRDIIED